MTRILRLLGVGFCLLGFLFLLISILNFRPLRDGPEATIAEVSDRATERYRAEIQDVLSDDHTLPLSYSEMRRQNAWFALVFAVSAFASGGWLIRRSRRQSASDARDGAHDPRTTPAP